MLGDTRESVKTLQGNLEIAFAKIARLERVCRRLSSSMSVDEADSCAPERPKGDGKVAKRRKQLVCFVCSGVGHFARECDTQGDQGGMRRGGIKCHKCGGWNHKQRNCPSVSCGPRCYGCGGTAHNYSACIASQPYMVPEQWGPMCTASPAYCDAV